MNKLCFLFFLFVPLLANAKTLTLQEAIQQLLQKNPNLKQERLQIKSRKMDAVIAEGIFGFDLDLSLSLDRSNQPLGLRNFVTGSNNLVADVDRERLFFTGKAGLKKLFSSGTVLSFQFEQSWALQNEKYSVTGIPNFTFETETANSVLTFAVSQPLLKGAWASNNLIPFFKAKHTISIAKKEVEVMLNQLLGELLRTYWDWVFSYKNLALQNKFIALAQEQMKSTQAMISAGKTASIELFQLQQTLASRKLEKLNAKNLILQAMTKVKSALLSNPFETLEPSMLSFEKVAVGTFPKLLQQYKQYNPSYQIVLIQQKIADLSVQTARRNKLPQLDLTANFRLIGLGNETARTPVDGTPLGNSFLTLVDPRSHGFSIGLLFSMPLDRRQLNSELEKTLIEVHQTKLKAADLAKQQEIEIYQLWNQLQRMNQQIVLSKESVRFSQLKMDAEKEKLKQGTSTLFNVLQYQQDLANTELSLLRLQVDEQKLILSLREKVGVLASSFGISKTKQD